MSGMALLLARARRSKHLKFEVQPGDIDVIAAAGMAGSTQRQENKVRNGGASLGILLLDCRQEWDAQRAEVERMEWVLRRNLGDADRTRQVALKKGEASAELEHERQVREARETLSTSRALAMMGLLSLREAFVALQNHATARALRRNLELTDAHIADIVHDALAVWLDQRCDKCNGTKETGLFGGPRAICTKCRGTGARRRVFPSKTSAEYVLGEWLIGEADRMVEAAQRKMQQALR